MTEPTLQVADTQPQRDNNGIIELNFNHPPRGDAASRYATSALAEEFLNDNRHLIEQAPQA